MSLFNFLMDFFSNGSCFVSILVLMDVSLQLLISSILNTFLMCFNPCFNGCLSSTSMLPMKTLPCLSFNPCFNGCLSSTQKENDWLCSRIVGVSILVLMDVSLQLIFLPCLHFEKRFNPCFNGCLSSTNGACICFG